MALDDCTRVLYAPCKQVRLVHSTIKCTNLAFSTRSRSASSFPRATLRMLKKAAMRTLSSSPVLSSSSPSPLIVSRFGEDHKPRQVLRYDFTIFRLPTMYGTSLALSVRQVVTICGFVSCERRCRIDLKKDEIKRVRACCFGEVSGGLLLILSERKMCRNEVAYYRPSFNARYGI